MRTNQPSPPPWDRKERKLESASDALGASLTAAPSPRWRDQQHHKGRQLFGQRDSSRVEPRPPPPGHSPRLHTEDSPSRSNRFNSQDERRQTRDNINNSTGHNSRSPSDIPKCAPYQPPIVTAPRSLAIPISTNQTPTPHPDRRGDTTLGPLAWKPLKWARHAGETTVKDVPSNASPVLSPRIGGDEVAGASRKKARLGWGQGLAKYEKEKVQGSVESSGLSESGFSGPVVTSPATPLSCTSRPPLQVADEKPCEAAATFNAENKTNPPKIPEPKEISINLDNINADSVNSLSTLLSNLLQQEYACTGDSSFLTKVSLLKVDISKEIEKTECEIDSIELELKSLDSKPDSKTNESDQVLLPKPSENALNDGGKLNLSENIIKDDDKLNIGENITLQVEEEEQKARVAVYTSTYLTPPSSSSDDNSTGNYSYAELISSINASNKNTAKLVREAIEKYAVVWSPEVDLWEPVRNSSLRKNDERVREKLRVHKREVKFKERVLAVKYMAFRRLWQEDLRLLELKKKFVKCRKRAAALNSVPVLDHSERRRNCIRSLLANQGDVSTLTPSKDIIQFTDKMLSEFDIEKHREFEKMPSQIIDNKQKQNSRFISKNGIISNPVSFEKSRCKINPWTREEIESFKKMLGTMGKVFHLISPHLYHKSTADCIEFYYKHRRTEGFRQVRKRLRELKKERLRLQQLQERQFMQSDLGIKSDTKLNSSSTRTRTGTSLRSGTGTSLRGKQKGCSLEDNESLAANILAGIGKAVSSEAVSSCITSLTTDPVSKTGQMGHLKTTFKGLDEDYSEESCGDELVSPDWSDGEKSLFLKAYNTCGKDFVKISECVGTRSRDECKAFFSKAQRSLGLAERASNILDAPGSPAGDGGDVCAAEIDSGICSLQSCSKVGGGVVGAQNIGNVIINESSNDGSCGNDVSVEKQEIVTDLNVKPDVEEEKNPNFGVEVKVGQERSVKKEAVPVVIMDDVMDTGTGTGTGIDRKMKDGGERPTGTVSMPHQTGTARSRRRASMDLGTSSVISFALDPGTGIVNEKNVPPSRPTFGTIYNSQPPVEVLPFMLKENQVNNNSRSVPVPFTQAFSNPPSNTFSLNNNNNNNNPCNLSQTTLNFEEHLNKNTVPVGKEVLQPYMQKNPLANQTNQMMHVVKGYPLQVLNNKRNEFTHPNQPTFALNNNKCEIQTRLPVMKAGPTETDQRPNRTGDVKLFGKILTQSTPSQKPVSNENIMKNNPSPKPNNPCLNILNGPSNNNNAFYPNHNSLGLDGLPVRSYGFWDGNRIQTGFSSLPESARIVAKYHETLAGVLPTTNLISGGVNNLSLSSFQQPHMQQIVSNPRSGFGMVVPMVQQSGVGTVSDPVAALKMHFSNNINNSNNINGSGEIWRDVGRR